MAVLKIYCANGARSQSPIENVLATAILLREETSLAKKFSVILGNCPAFHGLRSWSFEDKDIPNQEIGNEELSCTW
jgi:hypothetical protein